MSIHGIGTTSSIATSNIASDTSATQRNSSIPPPPPDSTSISQQGSMFSQLQQLSQQDPTRFKQVVSEMAKALHADASKQTGGAAQHLEQMASRLDQVASSGDVSQLAPPQSAQPASTAAYQGQQSGEHHHHHHGGGGMGRDLQQAFEAAMSATSSTTAQ